MLSADANALVATQQQTLNALRMKEITLFSSQLGSLAAVSSFLSANAFLGLTQTMNYVGTSAFQKTVVVAYFLFASVGFGACLTAAVCSSFVVIWGTQKAFRGRPDHLGRNVSKMYMYRRKMVRLLIIGVLANLLMGALLQVAKSHETGEGTFKALSGAVCTFFVGLCVSTCREVHGEFKLEKNYSWDQGGLAIFWGGEEGGRRGSGGERKGSTGGDGYYQNLGENQGLKEPILDLGV
ncbi:hypothetical protein TrRE_jg10092 [Triparma retinervis]|uniref:Uncharacterized protein n=1 Tax=Triparma retinervis TaxID=2557542 RepID=A0A9W7CAK7_9STRA|nr:hypothetical protein TrRE_jg10092 [Triparma retinervis]